jgi:hypothetical protein
VARFLVQGAVGKFPGASALTLCLALLAACTRSQGPGGPKAARPAGAAAAVAAVPPAPSEPTHPAAPTKPNPITLTSQPAPARPQPGIAGAGTGSLLVLGPAGLVMPEDFSIGPLADMRGGTDDEKAALASAAAFLASVAAGRPDGKLLAPESEKAVLDLLAPVPEGGAVPTRFRLGQAVSLPDGEISANVRLLRGQGSAEGELYLRREGSQWLVVDVQVNPAALAVARQRPKQRFFPSPYRWLLGQ